MAAFSLCARTVNDPGLKGPGLAKRKPPLPSSPDGAVVLRVSAELFHLVPTAGSYHSVAVRFFRQNRVPPAGSQLL